MANTDIKIDDDYIYNMGKNYVTWSENLQEYMNNYLKIMEAILVDSIMQGDTSEALREFVDYAKNLVGVIKCVGEESKLLCINYLQEIDKADSYLY